MFSTGVKHLLKQYAAHPVRTVFFGASLATTTAFAVTAFSNTIPSTPIEAYTKQHYPDMRLSDAMLKQLQQIPSAIKTSESNVRAGDKSDQDLHIEIKRSHFEALAAGPSLEPFLEARRLLFEQIVGQYKTRIGEGALEATCLSIVETADLLSLRQQIEDYGARYLDLLKASLVHGESSRQRSVLFKTLAALDVIEIRWKATPGDPGRALLLAPTHPLRLVWHLQHSTLCESALLSWRDKTATVPYTHLTLPTNREV